MTVPASHPPADRVVELADLTTLRLGGPVGELVEAPDEESLVEAVRSADEAGTPVLLVGGGSNLVVADEGYDGRVVLIRNGGITEESDLCGGAYVEIGAGENWDDVVATAVRKGWLGIEALSGIPGTTGATPIQNVGAYGQEVAQTVARVRTWDRKLRGIRTFAADECSFGYRTSRFKKDPGRFVVLSTTFQFQLGDLGPPVRYAELAGALGIAIGDRAPARDVREAVLDLRRRKAMVLDPADHDTWSTGSFFTNPVVPADVVPEGAPTWPQPDGSGQDERCLADRADRVHEGLRQRPGPALLTAHPCDHQPWWGHHRRAARSRARDPGGRAGEVRDHARQRAGARRLSALMAARLDRAAGGGRLRDGEPAR